MAQRPHASRIKAKTARLQLPVRQKPYDFTEIAVGYRRCRNRKAVADDYEDADGDHALDYRVLSLRRRAVLPPAPFTAIPRK
jgi:hypothetical protein